MCEAAELPSTAAWVELGRGFPHGVGAKAKAQRPCAFSFGRKASAATADVLMDALPQLFLRQVVWLEKNMIFLVLGKTCPDSEENW